VARRFLYETRRRGGYYPTKKLLQIARKIDAGDPVLDLVHPHLVALRDATGETVVLGKRQDASVIYLDVVSSMQAIRYTADPGEHRSLHANSIGKALFCVLDASTQKEVLKKIKWKRPTGQTLANAQALLADAKKSAARGWASNIGESVADLAAVAMPVSLASEWYGVSVVGPVTRMLDSWDAHLEALRRHILRLQDIDRARPPADQQP